MENTMNVGELKELLEECDDEQVVFVGHQPSWPLCMSVAGIRHKGEERETECPLHEGYLVHHSFRNPNTDAYEQCDAAPEEEDEDDGDEQSDRNAVWIVAGDHPWDRSPYAPRWLWEE